jgi:hypothetical protein
MTKMVNEAPCKVGDRIRLIEMTADPCPIPAGTTGTVTEIFPRGKIFNYAVIVVKWDIERSLNLVSPPDTFEVIE